MSGISFVADTNFLLYVLEGREEVDPFLDYRCAVSIISEIELLRWHKITSQDEQKIVTLLESCMMVELSVNIKSKAIWLRKLYKLKTADAIVVATAIILDLPLLTADKSLAKIEQVQLILID